MPQSGETNTQRFSHVITLVSNPENYKLEKQDAESLQDNLAGITGLQVLKEHAAIDLFCTLEAKADLKKKTAELKTSLADKPIDLVLQKLSDRPKKLFLADMDSTMIEQECIDELADELGIKPEIADITERAMRGEIEFEPALQERVKLLKGLEETVIDKVIEERITFTPGGKALLAALKANGVYCALVSGGFTPFTGYVAKTLGFDENRANTLTVKNGRLTGTVGKPILGKQAKLDTLEELKKKLNLSHHETIAIGDGANDLAMIEAAGLGVAYRAKPAVAAQADADISHTDLSSLIYITGLKVSV